MVEKFYINKDAIKKGEKHDFPVRFVYQFYAQCFDFRYFHKTLPLYFFFWPSIFCFPAFFAISVLKYHGKYWISAKVRARFVNKSQKVVIVKNLY